jgi:hypothetical protein
MHYHLVDPDRTTFGKTPAETSNSVARKDSDLHAVIQDIAPNCMGNKAQQGKGRRQ